MKNLTDILRKWIYCCSFLLLAACYSPESIEHGIVLKNFNIINLEDENILEDYVMIIVSDSILDILPEKEFQRTYKIPDSLILDGQGKYIMPSFHEMHAHLQPGNANHKIYLRHYLSYGVTNMRIMAGDDQLLFWKDSIQRGYLLGPDLKVAGPLIDGKEPLWGRGHNGPVVSNATKVDSIVASHKAKGYDLIKLYDRLPKPVYLEFVKAAEEQGLPVAAHIPYSLLDEPDLNELFNENSPSFEHFSNFGPLVTSREIKKTGQPDDFLYYGYELASAPDPSKIRQVVEKIRQSGTWICPTSVLWRNRSDSLRIARIVEGEPFQRLDSGLKNWWRSTRGNTRRTQSVNNLTELFLKEMAGQKVKVLVGTDFPNPFLIPGYSVHQEIHTLAEMGYSKLEALRAATIYPAQYWGEDDKKSLLSPGNIANMIILKENPLEEIKNTLTIEQVILKGRFLRPEDLLKDTRPEK